MAPMERVADHVARRLVEAGVTHVFMVTGGGAMHLNDALGATSVIVTHNLQQAARVSDRTVFLLQGELVEEGPTRTLFTQPRQRLTEDYITGRFG